MAAFEGNRSNNGSRSRDVNMRGLGIQAAKIPNEKKSLQRSVHGAMKLILPFPLMQSGNQCPIDPLKWKENGFIWNKKGWFHKAKYLVFKFPQNWQPLPESSIPGAAIERVNPHFEPNLVPLKSQDRVGNTDFRGWNFPPHRPRHPKPVRKTSRPTIFLDEDKIYSGRLNLLEFCFFIKWGGGKQVKGNFESWCRAQWGKDININILPNDFYMIKFMSNKEKWKAKNKGPYILDGIEVHIIEWQPNFNPRTHVLPNSKVWIRLYNCPSDYWHIDVIKEI
ncbi:hypothetical protein SUGI_0529010 [Cryptomeria japonica]|nr:hypothetical protein SUGI_0529010 [Cryptomeria japonica]